MEYERFGFGNCLTNAIQKQHLKEHKTATVSDSQTRNQYQD